MKPASLTWESEDERQQHPSVPQNGLYHFMFANMHIWGVVSLLLSPASPQQVKKFVDNQTSWKSAPDNFDYHYNNISLHQWDLN